LNIEQIVKTSGVSRSTVFRFLRGDNVRPAAKSAILAAMARLGYQNESAVNRQMNLEIEVSTSSDLDSFLGFTQVVNGITSMASQRGIQVNLVQRRGDQLPFAYEKWDGSKLGVIVIGKDMEEERLEAKLLLKYGIPHVFINRVMNDNAVSFVAVDLVKAGYDITKYLLERGKRRIGICGDVKTLRVDRDKIQGYQTALKEFGLPVSDGLCLTHVEKQQMEQAMEAMVREAHPDAFVGICDTYAMKFIGVAERLGYQVPQQIGVVGMDDVATGAYFRPALTTVHIPFYEMGELAVDSLMKQTAQDVRSIRTIVNHGIIVRESCGG
jgi:DNA-binding LacI/PurR family transcriptional regulator